MSDRATLDAEIARLEGELASMQQHHEAVWGQYGSELCAGEMLRKEANLQEQIDAKRQQIADLYQIPFSARARGYRGAL